MSKATLSPAQRLVSIFRMRKAWSERLRAAEIRGDFTESDKLEVKNEKPFLFYAEYQTNWGGTRNGGRETKMFKFDKIFKKSVASDDVQMARISFECMRQLSKRVQTGPED